MFAGKWMELEIIMLSEISQTNKDKYHMFFSYAESRALQKKKKEWHKCKGVCLLVGIREGKVKWEGDEEVNMIEVLHMHIWE
jgi:hypothetical protein